MTENKDDMPWPWNVLGDPRDSVTVRTEGPQFNRYGSPKLSEQEQLMARFAAITDEQKRAALAYIGIPAEMKSIEDRLAGWAKRDNVPYGLERLLYETIEEITKLKEREIRLRERIDELHSAAYQKEFALHFGYHGA